MHKETNQQRINNIYQMLLEMAEGNFSYRIPRTDDDDELEALYFLGLGKIAAIPAAS